MKHQGRTPSYLYSLVLLLSMPLLSFAADDLQDRMEIQQTAEDFVFNELGGEDIEVSVRRIDSRLRLQRCEQPLAAFWSPGARKRGATSVGVACEGDKPWKLYVRVNIKLMREVAVADRPLIRGDILQESDIRLEKRDVSRLSGGYLEDVSSLIGYEVRQSVSTNAVLRSRMFAAPKLIHRGDKVTIMAAIGGLEVRISGEALSDGGKGKMIRVRNLSSKRIVQGEVVSKGLVRITM